MTDVATIYVGNPTYRLGPPSPSIGAPAGAALPGGATSITSTKGQPNDGLDDLSLAGQVARKDALHGALRDPGRSRARRAGLPVRAVVPAGG